MNTPISQLPGVALIQNLEGFERMTFDEIVEELKKDTLGVWDTSRMHQLIREKVQPGRILMLIQILLRIHEEGIPHLNHIPFTHLVFLQEYFFIDAILSSSYSVSGGRIIGSSITRYVNKVRGARSQRDLARERTDTLAIYGLTPKTGNLTTEAVNSILDIETDKYSPIVNTCNMLSAPESRSLGALRAMAPLLLRITRIPKPERERVIRGLLLNGYEGADTLSILLERIETKGENPDDLQVGDIIQFFRGLPALEEEKV